MSPVDYIVIAVIAAILGFAAWFIYRSKKKGVTCIGCPDSGSCSGKCAGCAGNCNGCGNHQTKSPN